MKRSLKQIILRNCTKNYLREYEEGKMTHAVDAVFLGDYVSSEIIINGLFEYRELAFLAHELFPRLPRGSIALDIGANIGNHACFFANHFKRVVAFEPNPMAATLLRLNSRSCRIEVVQKGLSDTRATLNFSINRQNIGGSMITDANSDIEVEVERLDSLADSLSLHDVSFVKIDVEGHEDKVLAGASETLSKYSPVIAMEGFYKKDVEKGEHVSRLLREMGYENFYALSKTPKFRALTLSGLSKLLKRRSLALEPIESLAGRDHNLAIISKKLIHPR